MSTASWNELGASMNAPFKNKVMHQTWGHLFPEDMVEPVRGFIRVAYSVYGDITLLDVGIAINDSPWWYETMQDFICNHAEKQMHEGEVHNIVVDVHMSTDITYIPDYGELVNDGYDPVEYTQRLKIQKVKHKCLVKALQ